MEYCRTVLPPGLTILLSGSEQLNDRYSYKPSECQGKTQAEPFLLALVMTGLK